MLLYIWNKGWYLCLIEQKSHIINARAGFRRYVFSRGMHALKQETVSDFFCERMQIKEGL